MTLALAPASVNEFEYSFHAWRLGRPLLKQLSVDQHASELSSTQRLALVDRFTDPVDGDPVTVACLDVAVHAVVGDVELAVGEPLRERSLRPVEDLGEGFRPRQALGLGRPSGVSLSSLVHIGRSQA